MLPAGPSTGGAFISHSAGGWKSKIRLPTDVVPGESSFSSFLSVIRGRERACLGVPWMIFTLPDQGPPLSLHLTLITSLVQVHNGGWDFRKELGGYAVQSTAMTKVPFL